MTQVAVVAPKALWYLTRATGAVTLLLLSAAVVLGVLTSVQWASPTWPKFVVAWLHRNVSLVVLVFLAVHVATAVIDGFVPLRWIDAIIPFSAGYRPLWVGLGAVALDLLLAIVVTSLIRVRLGYRSWRLVHWTAYACWPIAAVHSVGTGSDAWRVWMLVVDAVAAVPVLSAAVWRVTTRSLGPVAAAGARG
ncbi:MAG: ferric reductase-like transmembrane domain-containing protein [Acidimicrobiia bacterium]|nr:ferric reductase-like transmembrane domain-containing protein [Acidimicrobiia bacterium]